LDAILFSTLAAVSAAAVFWLTVPETWVFGSLTIVLALLTAAVSQRQALSARYYVIASALTLSMTVTNWMTGIVLAFAQFPWRCALRITATAFVLVLVLGGAQKRFFHHAALLVHVDEITRFLLQPESGGPLVIARVFFFHSLIMPSITEVDRGNRPGLRMTVQPSLPGSATPWGIVAVGLWGALLSLGVWGAITTRGQRQLAVVLGFTLLGHFVLHQLYGGEETFLYALHWTPCLVVLAAFGALTRARLLALTLAGALVVCAAINNGIQFVDAVDHLWRYGTMQQPK
jgi:hypothetical protein